MISRVGRVGLVRVITCMEDVFHKIYTNSEINIQNIKLISSHPFLFHREYYLQWRSHIGLWHVFGSYFSLKHCVLICDDKWSKKEKCPLFHYSHLLFKCIRKRTPGNGVESEDHSTHGRCTLMVFVHVLPIGKIFEKGVV